MTTTWSAYIELAATEMSDSQFDDLVERLAEHSPAVGFGPSQHLYAQICVDAGTARKALEAALKAVTEAARDIGVDREVRGVELLTQEEFNRRLDAPQIPELAGLSEVASLIGVSRQRAGQLAAEHEDFPPAVARLKSGPVFVADQVRGFLSRWKRSSGRPAKKNPGDGLQEHRGTESAPRLSVGYA